MVIAIYRTGIEKQTGHGSYSYLKRVEREDNSVKSTQLYVRSEENFASPRIGWGGIFLVLARRYHFRLYAGRSSKKLCGSR